MNKDQEAIDEIKKLCPVGTTVHTIVRHVSRGNMQRVISVMLIQPDGKKRVGVRDLSALFGRAIGRRIDRDHLGVVVKGCGMNMCFELVSNVAHAVHGDSYAIKTETL